MSAKTLARRRLRNSLLSAASGVATPPVVDEASCTNVTFSTLTNPDGDGINYRLGVWNSSGNLVVTAGGTAQAVILDGGDSGQGISNNSSPGGAGGDLRPVMALDLDAGTTAVTVGAGATGTTGASQSGGASSIGSVTTANGGLYTLPGGVAGKASSYAGTGGKGNPHGITGAIVYYGPGGGGGNGVSGNGGATGGGQGENSVDSGNQTAGTANTGGGGGGRWNNGTVAGASGGSGKVMVRWRIA